MTSNKILLKQLLDFSILTAKASLLIDANKRTPDEINLLLGSLNIFVGMDKKQLDFLLKNRDIFKKSIKLYGEDVAWAKITVNFPGSMRSYIAKSVEDKKKHESRLLMREFLGMSKRELSKFWFVGPHCLEKTERVLLGYGLKLEMTKEEINNLFL